jgi:hypothetical protein
MTACASTGERGKGEIMIGKLPGRVWAERMSMPIAMFLVLSTVGVGEAGVKRGLAFAAGWQKPGAASPSIDRPDYPPNVTVISETKPHVLRLFVSWSSLLNSRCVNNPSTFCWKASDCAASGGGPCAPAPATPAEMKSRITASEGWSALLAAVRSARCSGPGEVILALTSDDFPDWARAATENLPKPDVIKKEWRWFLDILVEAATGSPMNGGCPTQAALSLEPLNEPNHATTIDGQKPFIKPVSALAERIVDMLQEALAATGHTSMLVYGPSLSEAKGPNFKDSYTKLSRLIMRELACEMKPRHPYTRVRWSQHDYGDIKIKQPRAARHVIEKVLCKPIVCTSGPRKGKKLKWVSRLKDRSANTGFFLTEGGAPLHGYPNPMEQCQTVRKAYADLQELTCPGRSQKRVRLWTQYPIHSRYSDPCFDSGLLGQFKFGGNGPNVAACPACVARSPAAWGCTDIADPTATCNQVRATNCLDASTPNANPTGVKLPLYRWFTKPTDGCGGS